MSTATMTRAALRKGCPSCGESVRKGTDVETKDSREGIRHWQVSYLYCPCCGLESNVIDRKFVGVMPWERDGGQWSRA